MTGTQDGAADGARQPLLDDAIVEDLLTDGGGEAGLYDLFVTRSHERLRELSTAVQDRDAAAVARLAHSLQGSCATFGAVRMAHAASRLAAADGRVVMSDAAEVTAQLTEILAQTEAALAEAAGPLRNANGVACRRS
jgi:HPt (histidine-containing phosphotransfer) domain-containing protein